MFFKYIGWTAKYVFATIKHKWYVLRANGKMPKKYRVSLYRALIHDWSKFTLSEAPHYGRSFFGDRKDPDGFQRAWLHHANTNPHHWQYWILETNKILPMPKKFANEMVVDWMGAGRAYAGSWDMSGWLVNNLNKIELEESTREYVYEVLSELGYDKVLERVKQKLILDKAIDEL